MDRPLLEVRDLSVTFDLGGGRRGVDGGLEFRHDPAELGHLVRGQDRSDVLIDTA